jgi:hypothetical protein
LEAARDVSEREVRDLPGMEFRTTVVLESTGCAVRIAASRLRRCRSCPAKCSSVNASKMRGIGVRKRCRAARSATSLDRLWGNRFERAMTNYLQRWIRQLRWQRLKPFQKLAAMLIGHLERILNYGGQRCMLLKAQRIAATRTEFVVFSKAA